MSTFEKSALERIKEGLENSPLESVYNMSMPGQVHRLIEKSVDMYNEHKNNPQPDMPEPGTDILQDKDTQNAMNGMRMSWKASDPEGYAEFNKNFDEGNLPAGMDNPLDYMARSWEKSDPEGYSTFENNYYDGNVPPEAGKVLHLNPERAADAAINTAWESVDPEGYKAHQDHQASRGDIDGGVMRAEDLAQFRTYDNTLDAWEKSNPNTFEAFQQQSEATGPTFDAKDLAFGEAGMSAGKDTPQLEGFGSGSMSPSPKDMGMELGG